jgi:hypothetical protein
VHSHIKSPASDSEPEERYSSQFPSGSSVPSCVRALCIMYTSAFMQIAITKRMPLRHFKTHFAHVPSLTSPPHPACASKSSSNCVRKAEDSLLSSSGVKEVS